MLNVIVLYQSLGVNFIWLGVWFLLWISSFLLFLHLRWILTCIEADDQKMETQALIQQEIVNTRFRILSKHKVHLWVNLVLFCTITFGVMIYVIVREKLFQHMDVLFLVFLHINIFCNVFTLSIMLLHWWNRERQKKEMKAYKSNDNPNKADSDPKEQNGGIANSQGNQNSSTSHLSSNSILASKFRIIVRIFYFLLEREECNGDPKKYGFRISFRRLFLLFGVFLMGYEAISSLIYSLQVSVKQVPFFISPILKLNRR